MMGDNEVDMVENQRQMQELKEKQAEMEKQLKLAQDEARRFFEEKEMLAMNLQKEKEARRDARLRASAEHKCKTWI